MAARQIAKAKEDRLEETHRSNEAGVFLWKSHDFNLRHRLWAMGERSCQRGYLLRVRQEGKSLKRTQVMAECLS